MFARGLRRLHSMSRIMKYSEEVAAAIAEGKPVVALESTIISHGMVRNIVSLTLLPVLFCPAVFCFLKLNAAIPAKYRDSQRGGAYCAR
jgi:hypothetical protein